MGRAKSNKEPSQLRKTGHNLTPAAVELVRTLSDLLRADESILIEVGIRSIFDKLPSGQKEAVSTILRAKGESLRGLRKLNNPLIDGGEGEGSASDPVQQRTEAIDRVHIRSTAPLDIAIEQMN